jgi:hypothetical protein
MRATELNPLSAEINALSEKVPDRSGGGFKQAAYLFYIFQPEADCVSSLSSGK